MSLDPGTQFDETALTAAEFDPQDQVLANSPVLSADVNTIAERALRRSAYLNVIKADLAGDTFTGPVIFNGAVTTTSTTTINSANPIALTSARTYTRVAKGLLHIDSTIWQPTGTAGAGYPYLVVQSITITPLTLADHLVYALDPHDASTITTVTARVKGGSLMGGLPANLPVVTLYRVDLTLGTVTSVGAQTDTSANIAAYQALHTVTISGLSEVVDSTKYAYLVRIQGDTGSGGTFGSEFYAPTCTFTRAKLGEE